jgi:hypothetical protein
MNNPLWHVYPVDDLREHLFDGLGCWCRPTEDEGLVTHNSMDLREQYETGERKPS